MIFRLIRGEIMESSTADAVKLFIQLIIIFVLLYIIPTLIVLPE